MRAVPVVVLLAVALGAYAKTSTPLLEHVPLQWKPTSELKLGTMEVSQAPIQFETFQDARDNKEAIGENLEDDTPKPVTTTDDVGAFVSRHMRCRCQRGELDVGERGIPESVEGALSLNFDPRRFGARSADRPERFTADESAPRALSAALWGLRRGPGVLGLTVEDRLRLGALGSPVPVCDLGLKLTRCPAGVAYEDPQTIHGIVTAEQLQ